MSDINRCLCHRLFWQIKQLNSISLIYFVPYYLLHSRSQGTQVPAIKLQYLKCPDLCLWLWGHSKARLDQKAQDTWLSSVPVAGEPGRESTVGWVNIAVTRCIIPGLYFYYEKLPRIRLAPGLGLQHQGQTASTSKQPQPRGLAQSEL